MNDPPSLLLSTLTSFPPSSSPSTTTTKLKEWNNRIENEFDLYARGGGSSSFMNGSSNGSGEDGEEGGDGNNRKNKNVEEASHGLHSILIQSIRKVPWYGGNDDGGDKGEEKSIYDNDDEAESKSHWTSNKLMEILSCTKPKPNNRLEEQSSFTPHVLLLSEILRSCKNLIRWFHQSLELVPSALTRHRRDSFQRMMTEQDGVSMENEEDPLRRLRSLGTLNLFLSLLEINYSLFGKGKEEGSSNWRSGMLMDDMARYASLTLFHSTHGSNVWSIRSKRLLLKAGSEDDSDDDDNMRYTALITKLLIGSNQGGEEGTSITNTGNNEIAETIPSSSYMLSVVRHLHSTLVFDIGLLEHFDQAVLRQMPPSATQPVFLPPTNQRARTNTTPQTTPTTATATPTTPKKQEPDQNQQEHPEAEVEVVEEEEDKTNDTLSVLVTTLTQCLCPPTNIAPFPPPQPPHPTDRRVDLVLEILRVMFAIKTTSPASYTQRRLSPNDPTMTRVGFLICEILMLPCSRDMGASGGGAGEQFYGLYRCKLASIHLLMDCPVEYGEFLVMKGCVQSDLMRILDMQVTDVVVVRGRNHGRGRTGGGNEDAAELVPILMLLNRLSGSNEVIKALVKEVIFPKEEDKEFEKALKQQQEVGGADKKKKKKDMQPLNAPRGTLRWKLIQLMTWTDSNVKRIASEFLWTLCDGNPDEFVLRTGFGNAVHMLGMRGLVQIPNNE